MTKRKRRKAMRTFARALLIGLFVVIVLLIIGAKCDQKVIAYTEYVVGMGDTIYSISKDITPNDIDWRKTSHHIIKDNDIENCLIRSGQVLTVPVYEEK